jgi:hypothetical protein
MFRTLIDVVLPWINLDTCKYKVKVVAMDHSDGLLNAAKTELKIGNMYVVLNNEGYTIYLQRMLFSVGHT